MRLNKDHHSILYNSLFYAIYSGLGVSFIVPFALALGASNTYVGILSAMPFLGLIISQIPGSRLMRTVSRRSLYVMTTIPSRLGIPLAAATAFIAGPYVFSALLIIVFLTFLLETLGEPTWASIAAESVSLKYRGAFFGLRGLIIHLGLAGSMFLAGVFLDMFPKENLWGFLILFSLAAVFGILASLSFHKIRPKPYRDHKSHDLKEFFTLKGPFKAFIIFACLFSFGHYLAKPFYQVYILENLGLSYTIFTLVVATTTFGRVISVLHLGKLADVVGDIKVMAISTLMTALVPLSYLFIHVQTWWLLFPASLISGVAWAGMEVSALNVLLDLSSEKHRGLRVAQYNTFVSIPIIIAPIVGGILADNVTFILSGIPLLFLLATFLRSMPVILLRHLKETRVKNSPSYIVVLHKFLIWHPAKEMHQSMIQLKRALFLHRR